MKTKDFLRKHEACSSGAKWALSISDDMADVWDAMIKDGKYAWLIWTLSRPGVFPGSVLLQMACRFVRETPLMDGLVGTQRHPRDPPDIHKAVPEFRMLREESRQGVEAPAGGHVECGRAQRAQQRLHGAERAETRLGEGQHLVRQAADGQKA